jgi:hypothetical protein
MEVLYQLSYPGRFGFIEPKNVLLEVEPPKLFGLPFSPMTGWTIWLE